MDKLFILGIYFLVLYNSCTNREPLNGKIVLEKRDTVYIVQNIDTFRLSDEFYILTRLPDWFAESKIMDKLIIDRKYKIENRLNPLYLEADFNGDGNIDIALPIKELSTNKKGFAIIHGKTFKVFIVGAGKKVKNSLGDDNDLNYIDIWKVNRIKNHGPTITETKKLILKNAAIEISKSEVGGGIIYWNGKEYAYYHETC